MRSRSPAPELAEREVLGLDAVRRGASPFSISSGPVSYTHLYAVCCKIVVPLAMFLVLFGQLQTFGIIK